MNGVFFFLNILHILNDGFKAAFVLLLPFIAKDMHLSFTQVGILAAILNTLSPLLALPSSYISRKLGSMKVLIYSLFIYGFGYLITGFTNMYSLLLITFFMTGAGFGMFHPISYAVVARVTEEGLMGRKMGEYTAVGDFGKIAISTLITFLVALVGWHSTSFLYAFVALFIGSISLIYFLKKPLAVETPSKKVEKVAFWHILKNNEYRLITTLGFFDNLASPSLYIFLPFLVIARHVPTSLVGIFTAIFFIGTISGKTVLGRYIDKYSTSSVFILCELLMAFFIFSLANIPNLVGIIISVVLLGIFTKGTSPIIATMVSNSAQKHGNYEKAFALNHLTTSLAATLAPIILGFFSDKFGIFAAFNASAIFALIAVMPAFWLRRNQSLDVVEAAAEEVTS